MFGDGGRPHEWLEIASSRILERADEILESTWREVERVAVRLEREAEIEL
jgi:hypothetical protein